MDLHVGDVGLRNAESRRDGCLFLAPCQGIEDCAVAGINLIGPGLHRGDDPQRMVGPLGFDLEIWPTEEKQRSTIMGVGGSECEQRTILTLGVGFDSTVPEPGVNAIKDGPEGVGDPDSDAAFLRVDFDGAFAIQEASDVTGESVVGKLVDVHTVIIWSDASQFNIRMAVPVMRWIGQRIQMANDLGINVA
jgi:hypothetical protein